MESKHEIITWIQKYEKSQETMRTFVRNSDVPYSRIQFSEYVKRYKEHGVEALSDKRTLGGNRKLTKEMEIFLEGLVMNNNDINLSKLSSAVKKRFHCAMSPSGISRAISRVMPDLKLKQNVKTCDNLGVNPFGGFELLIAMAFHVGWVNRTVRLIKKRVGIVKRSKSFKENKYIIDQSGRDDLGHFTLKYNSRKDVRKKRFLSIDEKRKHKNWQSMNIITESYRPCVNKVLAAFSLPIVTSNGLSRSVDVPLGNSLKHLCGYNYKQTTLSKFFSELKYLGISVELLKGIPKFWSENLSETNNQTFVCYYIDGNTKALWSSKRVKKNKVTMLGRVMGCLETVFIHDCFGQPIYFETHSGHAPTGEHILGLFEKIEDVLVGMPHSNHLVNRAIVMDSANNSVKTLRAFANQNTYHFITLLDDNQWKSRRIIKAFRSARYRYGKATLKEHTIDLVDSTERTYSVSCRAIYINWDNGKRTVVITSLPKEIIDSSDVVYAYFMRWPAQELQFKYAKSGVSLSKVAGYGKTEVENVNTIEKQKKSQKMIVKMKNVLRLPMKEIALHEEQISKLIPKERKIKEKGKMSAGKRIIPKEFQPELKRISSRINKHEKEIKNIKQPWVKEFAKLHKHQREWLRLQGKEKEYAADVELDQIMTYFRICLISIFAYMIKKYFGNISMEFSTFVQRIANLQAQIEETDNRRIITLFRNKNDLEMMVVLERAILKINKLKIRRFDDKIFVFVLTK